MFLTTAKELTKAMHNNVRTVGIIGKFGDAEIGGTIYKLSAFLLTKNLRVLLHEHAANVMPGHGLETADHKKIGESCDLCVIVGGDGTMLNAARALYTYGIPLVGINRGRLGFLADISPDTVIERINDILLGGYIVEERFLLHATIERGGEIISESSAFNDVVVAKWNMARMIEFETYVNDQFVNSQRSDGLILSTPTGSTAYALSGGGPIMHPTINAIVLVPICPHTLSSRPIVVSGDSHIDVVVTDCNYDHAQVTCDGQINFSLFTGDRIHVCKIAKPIRLIHPADHDHFEILREKLRWGTKLD